MNKPFVTVHDLFFGFTPHEPFLKNVSFTLRQHECMALIGPNGSGKSTLLKLLLGELRPNKGTIHIDPTARLAYVPQSLRFDSAFPITALEVVLGGCYRLQNKMHRAEKALDMLGMLDLKKSSFGTLSGGQQQRVLLARAFAQEPTLLLLDEPTSSVDTTTQQEMLSIIRDQKKTCTTLMVTHNLQSILNLVDGVLCLQEKTLFMKPKEICEHFALGLYHEPLINVDLDHFMGTNP